MTRFERHVNLNLLKDEALGETPWMLDLLKYWSPAGHAGSSADPEDGQGDARPDGQPAKAMRLGIRNGYLNFYNRGQAVAKVYLRRNIYAHTHQKYLGGTEDGGQSYVRLGKEDKIDNIIKNSCDYRGFEKPFVDEVCAASGAVIDLEIALPFMGGNSTRSAPRIDLAVLESFGDNFYVAFWEAKLSSDPRMRAEGDKLKVEDQLKQYREWFRQPDVLGHVLKAYRSTCKLLCELHKRAAALGIAVPSLDQSICNVAEDPERLKAVDPKVRLLIDCRQQDDSFENKHLGKLRDKRIYLHCVRSSVDFALPQGIPRP